LIYVSYQAYNYQIDAAKWVFKNWAPAVITALSAMGKFAYNVVSGSVSVGVDVVSAIGLAAGKMPTPMNYMIQTIGNVLTAGCDLASAGGAACFHLVKGLTGLFVLTVATDASMGSTITEAVFRTTFDTAYKTSSSLAQALARALTNSLTSAEEAASSRGKKIEEILTQSFKDVETKGQLTREMVYDIRSIAIEKTGLAISISIQLADTALFGLLNTAMSALQEILNISVVFDYLGETEPADGKKVAVVRIPQAHHPHNLRPFVYRPQDYTQGGGRRRRTRRRRSKKHKRKTKRGNKKQKTRKNKRKHTRRRHRRSTKK